MSSNMLQYESEIVESLECADLESLSEEAAASMLISQEVKESFDSLDSDLPHPLKLRYLLLRAYNLLEGRPSLPEKWLELLAKYGASSNVLAKVRLSSIGGDVKPLEAGVLGNTNQPQTGARFSKKHVSALTEMLASCSGKWRNISIALNLPDKVRMSIEERLHMYHDSEVCLSKILSEWVEGNHAHAKPPTVASLKKALRSLTVGLGVEASLLEESSLNKHGIYLTEQKTPTSQPQIASANLPPLEIARQSLATTVSEGKSTLLEVQARTVHGAIASYRWMKDGSPLNDNEYYLGVNIPVLCINRAILALQGSYTCEVTIDAESDSAISVCSKPVVVSVAVSPAAKVLVDMYSSLPDLHEDTWPPVSSNTYINLALIKEEEINNRDCFCRYTIRGDVDDIMDGKKSIKYEEAFKEYKNGTFILVEGRPGSGKTTLVHKLSKDWASGVILKGAKLVFFTSLRVLPKSTRVTLKDILYLFYQDEKRVQSVFERIDKDNGEGVCFILDGLDEYSGEQGSSSVVFKLAQRQYLQQSMVILASRHVATAKLRKKADTRVEVVGFLQQQIFEYIDHYPFTSATNTSESLKAYLTQHPNILRMCYLPVHASMVCFLHDKMETTLPQTESGIYKHFTLFTLLRKLRLEDEFAFLESVDDLTRKDKEFFLALCKLAFDMTSNSKQMFKRNELPSHFSAPGGEKSFLGFVSVDYVASLYGLQNLYTFVHLTFQEYLAACHVSQLAEEEQLEIMRQFGEKSHMKVVWKFYCGLVSFCGEKSKFEKILSFHNDTWFHCQCSFESQDPSTCESVVLFGDNRGLKFDLENRLHVNPSDFSVISYIMSNSVPVFEEFIVVKCFIRESVMYFESSLKLCTNLRILDLSYNSIGVSGAQIIGGCLEKFGVLRSLNVCQNGIADEGAKALADGLKSCVQLESLYLGLNRIGGDGAKALCEALVCCRKLRVLHFSENIVLHFYDNILYSGENRIGNVGSLAISDFLTKHGQLHSLAIRDNNLTGEGFASLARGLKNCSELQSLDLSSNSIDADHSAFADGLKHCRKMCSLNLRVTHINGDDPRVILECLKSFEDLQCLDLGCNFMYDADMITLRDCLKNSQNLKELYLELNNFTENGVKAIGEILAQSKKLEIFNLASNEINNGAADIIGRNIVYCNSLKKLYLYQNRISDDGLKSLAEGLKHCSQLTSLQLFRNSIGDEGIKALGESMEYWSHNLKYLSFGENYKISDTGVMAFAKGLKHCNSLVVLHLKSGRIGNKGAKSLGENLRHCDKLEDLYLDSNKIGDTGATDLVHGANHCKCLRSLGLYQNNISQDCANALAKTCVYRVYILSSSLKPGEFYPY